MKKVKLAEVFRFLREAKCPHCGDPNAYVGLNKVECDACGGDPERAKQMKAGSSATPASSPGGYVSPYRALWNHFSKSRQEYEKSVGGALDRVLGKAWRQVIDRIWGQGEADKAFDNLWKNNWTDYEGAEELAGRVDSAYNVTGANSAKDFLALPQADLDDAGVDYPDDSGDLFSDPDKCPLDDFVTSPGKGVTRGHGDLRKRTGRMNSPADFLNPKLHEP